MQKKILCLIVMTLMFSACGTSLEDPSELLTYGKQQLIRGDGGGAFQTFTKLQKTDPRDLQADYGILLSEIQELGQTIAAFYDFAAVPVPQTLPEDFNPAEVLSSLNHLDLTAVIIGAVENMFHEPLKNLSTHAAKIDTRTIFSLSHFPFVDYGLDKRKIPALGGEFDQGDALFFSGIAYLLRSALHTLTSLNLDFDLNPLIEIDFKQEDSKLLLKDVISVFYTKILPQSPEFLKLNGEKGAAFRKQAIQEINQGLTELLLGFDGIKKESDDQSDDILAYVDENENRIYDAGEAFKIGQTDPFPVDGLISVCFELQTCFEHPGNCAFDIAALSPVLNDFANMPFLMELPRGCVSVDLQNRLRFQIPMGCIPR